MTSYGFKMALPTELPKSPGYFFFKQVTKKKKGKKLRRALESKGIFNKNNGQKRRLVVRVPRNSTDEGPGPKRLERNSIKPQDGTFVHYFFVEHSLRVDFQCRVILTCARV